MPGFDLIEAGFFMTTKIDVQSPMPMAIAVWHFILRAVAGLIIHRLGTHMTEESNAVSTQTL